MRWEIHTEINRLIADSGLNQLNDDLKGKEFIAGKDIGMADILLYGFMGAVAIAMRQVSEKMVDAPGLEPGTR